jgi:AraC-like DNA-binding protein
MLVLAAVPNMLDRRLQSCASPPFKFVPVESWSDVISRILRDPVEIAVIDPALEGKPRAHDVERLRILFPSLPIILYTKLSPEMAPVLLRLGHSNIRKIVLAWYDDHPQNLRDVLYSEAAQSVSHRMLNELHDILAGWPDKLRWAIETIIREPADIQTVQALADRAGMDRRTCLRWFARARLPAPSEMLTVLRVAYAHRLLQDPGYTVEDVATKLGYAQTRTFALNVKEVFGMTPSDLRVSLSPDEAMAVVRNRYLQQGRGRDSLASVS